MKTTKLLLSSFILAGMLSACANEDMLEVPQNNAELASRPQVNLTISNPVETKFTTTGENVKMTANDLLGAVLVDGATLWTVAEGHVGNNKWAYNTESGKFETDGTTSIGSWLFYTNYKEAMTTSRGGVKTTFPQIQEGSADWKWLANNNINFLISPIIKLDGYEGESMDIKVPTMSIYNYLNIKLKFADEEVTKVNKIIVKAKKGGINYGWPKNYVVNNTNLAQADIRSAVLVDQNGDETVDGADREIVINKAFYAMQNVNYDYSVQLTDNIDWTGYDVKNHISDAGGGYDFLVLDCDANHTDAATDESMSVDGEFSAWMLMPAGEYESIILTIYTNNGVYTKTVSDRCEWVNNLPVPTPTGITVPATDAAKGKDKIYLRNNVRVNLANVQKSANVENYDYLLVETKDLSNKYITKTSDLIDFINGVQTTGDYDVRVVSQPEFGSNVNGNDPIPAHSVVLNSEVMSVLTAKETELEGEVHLNFVNAEIEIKGTETGYLELHHLTFTEGAKITEGNVKIVNDVTSPQTITAKAGSVVEIAQTTTLVANKFVVENGATVNVTGAEDECVSLNDVEVYGTLNVENTLAISYLKNYAGKVSVTSAGNLSVHDLEVGQWLVKATYGAKLANTGTITINNSGSVNNGTISNNGKIYVKGSFGQYYDDNDESTPTVTTNGTKGVFEACGTAQNASIVIGYGTTFVNKNELQTAKTAYQNTITNMGTIDVWKGATTLITNNADATTGVINLAERAPQFFNVSNPAKLGYIVYKVSEEGTFTPNKGKDVFNTVVFEKAVTFAEAAPVDYGYIANIVAYNTIDLSAITAASAFGELSFMGNGAIYTPTAGLTFAKMTIAEDVKVSLPAKQKLTITTELVNNGTFVVSGTATIKHGATDGDVKETGGNITWN